MDGEVEDYEFFITPLAAGTDWGDAPDPTYPTVSPAGANHGIVAGYVLGATIDPELNGQPTNLADGDDTDVLGDDEDGVTFLSKIVAGTNAAVDVVAGVLGGTLDAWIDFNADGDWNDLGEKILGTGVAPGLNNLTFSVPQPSALGPTFARFRLSQAGTATPGGAANDGEVEDYAVDLYQPIPTNLVITNLFFTVSNTVANVEWTSQNNILYQMQASTNLTTNVWVDVEASVPGPLNSQNNNTAESDKFYRITVPWTP